MSERDKTEDEPLVLYDGDCGLCGRAMRFVARRDRSGIFRFAPLRSATGVAVLSRARLSPEELDTLVLRDGGRILTRSAAALAIAARLPAPWHLARFLAIVPRPVRDWLYDRVARNRLRFFPAGNACPVPSDAAGETADRGG